ncbi:vitamin B12 dependent-methionine synthase activation domain-containing protein [Chloroflexota bacterium]
MVRSEFNLMLEGLDIIIKRTAVLRRLGYRTGEVKPEIEAILSREIEEGYHLITPRAVYSRQPVKEHQQGTITLNNQLSLNTGSLAEEWLGSEHLGVVICTIGPALEDKVDELFAKDDYLSALILDSAGSVVVEALADEINYLLCRRERGAGNKVGPRASPGYGKWHLSHQKLFFSLLPAHQIKVRLNQQCMMIPRKSISFCLGIGKGLDYRFNPCRRCGKEGCGYRWSPEQSIREIYEPGNYFNR